MPAMRKLTIATLVMSAVICGVVYDLKSRVTALDRELRQVRAQIAVTDQTVHLLQAEWTHLNQPDILNALVTEHTALAPVNAEQLVTLDDITREAATATLASVTPTEPILFPSPSTNGMAFTTAQR
jgi:hypothetical protein